MPDKARGRCYCGKVKFEIILPVKNVINCHCNMCRRLSGADYTTWVSVVNQSLTITHGIEHLAQYEINGQSTQTFCTVCATRITAVSSLYPEIAGILRGIIDDDINCKPTGNYFVSDKAGWANICNGLPCYGGPSGFDLLNEFEATQ